MAPHVVVDDVTLDAIRETRERSRRQTCASDWRVTTTIRDVAFHNWCDVWLDPAFRSWTLEPEAERVTCPVLLIQGTEDPYGTLDQLDRIEARVRGPVRRLLVPGGHSPHRDAPESVLREVAAFVEEVDELTRRRREPRLASRTQPGTACRTRVAIRSRAGLSARLRSIRRVGGYAAGRAARQQRELANDEGHARAPAASCSAAPSSHASAFPSFVWSRQLGVSRTPLRTALMTLEHEGLLETLPGGGFVVREFTRTDINDSIELRGVLEGTAARLAAERLEAEEAARASPRSLSGDGRRRPHSERRRLHGVRPSQ